MLFLKRVQVGVKASFKVRQLSHTDTCIQRTITNICMRQNLSLFFTTENLKPDTYNL